MGSSTQELTKPEETHDAGRKIASRLHAGDILLLEGPLGSGKTTFVQGIAEDLGATQPVTSPSFIIMQEYSLGRGRETRDRDQGDNGFRQPVSAVVLRHLDLYRLPDPSVDLERIGLPELLDDQKAITVIEWADLLPASVVLPVARLWRVQLAYGTNPHTRTVGITAPAR